jgi:hypothetical protein
MVDFIESKRKKHSWLSSKAHQWQLHHHEDGDYASLTTSDKGNNIDDDNNTIAIIAMMPA